MASLNSDGGALLDDDDCLPWEDCPLDAEAFRNLVLKQTRVERGEGLHHVSYFIAALLREMGRSPRKSRKGEIMTFGKLDFSSFRAAKRAKEEAIKRADLQTIAERAAEAKAVAEARQAREAAEAAKVEQRRQERADARREAARRDAIINSRYAKDDPVYAIELAWQSDLSSSQAIETLRAHAQAKRTRSWTQAMARAQNRPWDDGTEQPSAWDDVMRKVSGR